MRERARTLEDEFFDRQNRALLERLKAESRREEQRSALARSCGITDRGLLDQLIDHDVGAETLAALVLVPLVMVAWADDQIAWGERKRILELATEHGIEAGSPPAELLEHWLATRPSPGLLRAWSEYVSLLMERLDEAGRKQLERSTLERAREVARAAGGMLGVGPRVSSGEQAVLDRLAAAFEVD